MKINLHKELQKRYDVLLRKDYKYQCGDDEYQPSTKDKELLSALHVILRDVKGDADEENAFEVLLGEERLADIIENNWVEFERKNFEIYKTNEIEMSFLTTDNKGDDVIHCSVCYNEDRKKWYSSNCIDNPSAEFDSYDEMRKHLESLEQKIVRNGFNPIYLPE